MGVSIRDIQRAQAAMLRAANAVKPRNGLAAAVKAATIDAHRYVVYITHVDTGGLRAAHKMAIRGARGEIYIDPSARRSDGDRPAIYGVYEHRRGGSHAFYERTVAERHRQIGEAARRELLRWLP